VLLTLSGDPSIPVHDRLAWLSCARLLLSASEASRSITSASPGLQALYAGEEEHLRHQFYLLLQPSSLQGVGASRPYFAADSSPDRSPIEERSIKVIYGFAEWPDGRQDAIDAVPKYTKADLQAMHAGMRGVRDYVSSMPRFQPSGPGASHSPQ
jgi:hypothetical protein